MGVTVGELAKSLGLAYRGDATAVVNHAASLAEAGPGSLTFLANSRYRRHLADTQATLVVLEESLAGECPTNALIAPNPHLAYAHALALVMPRHRPPPHVHDSAVVDETAYLGERVHVGAQAYIGPDCHIEDDVEIGPGCVLMRGVMVRRGARLVARVTICDGSVIGESSVLQPGAVIGAEGFGFAQDNGQWIKVPQVGRVVIGAHAEVGANTTIDCGAIGDTVIGDGVKIDNLVQVGHNCRIGDHSIMVACSGVAGSTEIGRHCAIGGMSAIAGHIRLVDGVQVTGMGQVTKSLTEPGVYSSGTGVEPNRQWRRSVARFHQLDDMAKRLRELEKRLRELDGDRDAEGP
ncbi:UDP-3-O-[3-hydroxymyristoyl] glucosamine N-acyltransferase [Natronocella acetinitrilica]|uniref:UDP-3-O-acylglucosamine N-acyltransferase n=1 Tax=Natronocella acetinitrilica TaxID=414046 RepID=A0AAE3G5C8_9GAMM|nr:UDP-3-O-[3-hydroxymyristoyl] glucosamine N-acyltransferase [Natronocella acetinitrilica]